MEIRDVEACDEANPAFTQTNASHASAIALAYWARCNRVDGVCTHDGPECRQFCDRP